MKILPLKAMWVSILFLPSISVLSEGQSGFFGKKGITLHVTHSLAKIGGRFVDHAFAHSLDNCKQVFNWINLFSSLLLIEDSALVFGIVRHVLGILETKGISKVYIRSDNAGLFCSSDQNNIRFPGAYKNGSLIASLFHLSSPNLIIGGYHFSESQAGKV